MKNVFKGLALMSVAAATLFAQAAAPAAAPAAGPSPDEIKDIQAIQQKQVATPADADAKMTMVNQFVAKYPTSALKGYVLTLGGEAAQAKRDSARARYYYEQGIAADPQNDYAMVMLGAEIAQNTGEHDLDKKDKLSRAEKLAKDAMVLIEKRQKQPQEQQAQFDQEKALDMARAHMTLGLVAMADQKDEAAGNEFLQAAAGDAMNLLRAGMAFNNAKKTDQANAALDKFIAIPGLPDQYKKMAEDEKKRGQSLKK
ncbi:MAG: hypothetical protein RL328_1422 [Acidobacteriota bacterium]|jgi:tetratricopeptide (TPR) repeat protein